MWERKIQTQALFQWKNWAMSVSYNNKYIRNETYTFHKILNKKLWWLAPSGSNTLSVTYWPPYIFNNHIVGNVRYVTPSISSSNSSWYHHSFSQPPQRIFEPRPFVFFYLRPGLAQPSEKIFGPKGQGFCTPLDIFFSLKL